MKLKERKSKDVLSKSKEEWRTHDVKKCFGGGIFGSCSEQPRTGRVGE